MSKRKSVILVCVLVLVVALMAAAYFAFRPVASAGDKILNITVTGVDGESESYTVSTDDEYLWDAMYPDHIDGIDSEYGKWITTVDGEIADESAGRYWMFTKSGEWVTTSVDKTPVADGESYEFFIYQS